MPHPRFTVEEIVHRGKELYDKRIRAMVETMANVGTIVSIDIRAGDFEVGDDLI